MTKRAAVAPVVEFTDQGAGTVRYLEHGSPSERIHWHLHDDYELHLIVATSGKVFVGDYLGQFGPGQLILTGPRLPHNWITTSNEAVDIRDMVFQFSPTVMNSAMQLLPELTELKPMLERARSGLQFEGVDLHRMKHRFRAIRDAQRMERLNLFLDLMLELSRWSNYRLLSTVQVTSPANEHAQQKVSAVIDYVMEHYAQPISLSDAAHLVNMTDTYFSKFFRQSTGHRFVDLVNRVRISRACSLLVESDQNITTICYTVGFNNVANFNRRFQELKGVTPRSYRKEASERDKAVDGVL